MLSPWPAVNDLMMTARVPEFPREQLTGLTYLTQVR
jgi:hypothetical protein